MICIDEFSVGCKRIGLKLQPFNSWSILTEAMNIGVAYFKSILTVGMNIEVAYVQQMQALVTDKSVPSCQYQMGINQQPTPRNVKQSTKTKISYLYSSQFIDQFSYRILREFSVFAKLKVLVFVVSWKLFVLDLLAK